MSLPYYSLEEVRKHCSRSDAWIVVKGKVYAVTPFLDDHPGGEDAILKVSGKDATEDFDGVGHSSLAWIIFY
ncbi:Cytochrome B5 isoform D [Galdieria sulphuraria]|nr:Cytochrome B5 isoform D [Galdieria sulphuraria]